LTFDIVELSAAIWSTVLHQFTPKNIRTSERCWRWAHCTFYCQLQVS